MRQGGGERRAREGLARGTLEAVAMLVLLVGICLPIVANLTPTHNHEGIILKADGGVPLRRAGHKAPEPMPTLAATGGVNVNTAAADELIAVKGIGPALAASIIAERELNGRFAFPEDLLSVKGIGRSTLMKLLPQITLR